MSKIVISGFYGYHNIGDEAILRTLTKTMRSLQPNVEITVLSNNPEETKSKFGVNAVDRSNVLSVFYEISKCDILISGGGSLLQDVTSARSIWYYLTIIRAGLFFRKRVILLSHGIGPLIRERNKKRVRRVLNKVDKVTVRDNQSALLLKEIGVDMNKVSVTTDPVMGMEMSGLELGKTILEDISAWTSTRKKVAIAVRQKDFRDQVHKEKLVTLTNKLAQNYEVYFLPFYYKNDTKIYDDLHELVDEHVHFVIKKYQSDAFMSLVENMDVLIGSRLHSLIFAMVAEVPFVGISYDPKIENFLETVSKEPVCSILDFDPNIVIESVETIFERYEIEKLEVIKEKHALIEKLQINVDLIQNLLSEAK